MARSRRVQMPPIKADMTICPLTSACDPKRELQRRICNHYGDTPEPNGKFLNDFSRARAHARAQERVSYMSVKCRLLNHILAPTKKPAKSI
jgi:hypothetical protein